MKIATIIGARPQFIKAAMVSKAIAEHNRLAGDNVLKIVEVIVHTGQHYDDNMSNQFFLDLEIPEPKYNLGIGSAPHGKQTGRMIEAIERVLLKEIPDWVLVYGDTNSTLAGALASVKLHIPVAHVEAGLRSFNRQMPEEINRVLIDHCSELLFCPTSKAVNNLRNEGFTNIANHERLIESIGSLFSDPSPSILNPYSLPLIINVGDVMYDSVLQFSEIAQQQSTILQDLGVKSKGYLLVTVHRPCNTDDPLNFRNIISALLEINEPIIFPVHPRSKKLLNVGYSSLLSTHSLLKIIEPVGYLDMLVLEQNARIILTDSGGIQKEAYFFGVPCITMRTETEWVETVETGWNIVVGGDHKKIVEAVSSFKTKDSHAKLYGDGSAAKKIVGVLELIYGTEHEIMDSTTCI